MNALTRFALLALLSACGCLVPACTPVHVHTQPQTADDVSSLDDVRMGAVQVKNGSGTLITLKSRTDGSDEVPMHDIGVITAGDTNIGNVDLASAIPAGTNNIGDVDVLSSALPSGASTSANQTTVIGHVDGVEALLGSASTAAHQVTTHGYVDGLEAYVDGIETTLTSIETQGTTAGSAIGTPFLAASNADQAGWVDARGFEQVWIMIRAEATNSPVGLFRFSGALSASTTYAKQLDVTASTLQGDEADTGVTVNAQDIAINGIVGSTVIYVPITNPPPYIYVEWDNTSGGSATSTSVQSSYGGR